MFFSAIAYAGIGSLLGVAVLLAGIPVLALEESKAAKNS
jgi:hypothetical protein